MPPTPTPTPSAFLVQLVGEADSSSWLGPALLSGLFLVIGAVLAFLSTYLSDGRRAKQEREQRFHNELRATSSELLRHADELDRHASILAALLRSEAHVLKRESTQRQILETRDLLLDTADEVIVMHASLQLIASRPVREASNALSEQAGRMALMASDHSPGLDNSAIELTELNIAFQNAVRKVLTGRAD